MFPLLLSILWQFRATKGLVHWVCAEVSDGPVVNVELYGGSQLGEPKGEDLSLHGQGQRWHNQLSDELTPCLDTGRPGFPGIRTACAETQDGKRVLWVWLEHGSGGLRGQGQRICEGGQGEGLLGWVSPVLASMGISKHQLLQGRGLSLPLTALLPLPGMEPGTR